ncbi:MAG: NusG domain II-containing protein [Gammaproteobacteria bacterium]|nr:NusG domain II-containing protein [Gammaproteobacteria bacterium]
MSLRHANHLTILDGMLVAASILIILVAGKQLWFDGFASGDLTDAQMVAEVRVSGALAHSLTLDQNATITTAGRRGESILEVKEGAVRFVSSPCPHQHCVRAGWLRRPGAVAFCLPNGVGLQLINTKSHYDSINF